MNTKLEKIKEILKDTYKDKMSVGTIDACAKEIYEILFLTENSLNEIALAVIGYETDEGIEDAQWDYVFCSVIELLDNNAVTAKRLYNSFMYELDEFDTFLKLVNENAEYLCADELAKAKEKAFGLFDRQLLECFGITR